MNQRKPTDVLRLVGDFWGEFLRLLLSWFANSIWPCESAQHFECILWTSYVGISYKVGLSKKLSRYGRNTSPNTPPRPSEISEKNGFTYVLTFFSLISDGLGGVPITTPFWWIVWPHLYENLKRGQTLFWTRYKLVIKQLKHGHFFDKKGF